MAGYKMEYHLHEHLPFERAFPTLTLPNSRGTSGKKGKRCFGYDDQPAIVFILFHRSHSWHNCDVTPIDLFSAVAVLCLPSLVWEQATNTEKNILQTACLPLSHIYYELLFILAHTCHPIFRGFSSLFAIIM